MTRIRFGTDGIRGLAGAPPCTAEVGMSVGRAAARLARAHAPADAPPVVVVGRDTRPSGPGLQAAVVAGVTAEGVSCLLADVVPTAAVGIALHAGLGHAGVVITASHNAAPDNGFKVLGPGGRKLTDPQTAQVEAWLADPAQPCAPGAVIHDPEGVLETWWAALRQAAPRSSLAHLTGRRIAVDLAHGALSVVAGRLAELAPAEWVVVGAGEGTINDGVGSEHLAHLGEVVRTHGCAMGFAVDGDADRCRVVDERGAPVPGDAVTWLLARTAGLKALAVTVMSNGALEPSLPGVEVVRTPVGDKHLQRVMDARGIALGAEESGHILFAEHPAGDGLAAGLRAAGAALRGSAPVSSVFAGFSPLPRATRKVGVARRPPLAEVASLEQVRREQEALLGRDARVFLRYSGTEPVLRVLVEGHDPDAVAAAAEIVSAAAAQALS